MQYAPGARHPSLYLIAAMLTVQTPFAEVLTVVRQQPVSVLAHPGARPTDHFSTRESRWRIGSDPDRATAGETIESCFFHRASAQAVCESRVVHDLAAANVDSVMQISATRCVTMCEANRGSCSATKSHFALFKSMSLMTACLQVTCHSQFRRELLIAGTSAHHGRSGWSLDCTMLRPTTCCDYLGVIHDEVALASSRPR